jgi:serine/threonine protein kinase
MPQGPPPDRAPTIDRLQRKKLLAEFDQAWRKGPPPLIEDAFPADAKGLVASDSAWRELLEELVKIDLGYRWRAPAQTVGCSAWRAERPRLEDYVARYPVLGPLDCLCSALIVEEYWVRHRWGDHPNHDEYLARFARPELRDLLHRADVELAAELLPALPRGTNGLQGPPLLPSANAPVNDDAPLPMATPVNPTETVFSVRTLSDFLRNSGCLSQAHLTELSTLQERWAEPHTFAQHLLDRGWLTAYQVERLLGGQAAELVLGPYLILDRLAEGGAGQVLKARHLRMNRVVALKIIRQELLGDPEVVARFYREMQLVGKLSHRHVVQAFDAGPIGATHVLVMEHVEGIDLNRLIRKSGPLPVVQTLEYVRQAALGLQHAHERGLVHRDVKPSNLLLVEGSAAAVVKILDFGLARLQRTRDGDITSVITPVSGALMGTPDYLAPEQALRFHSADIRADIYGLGCTLFFLLTGRPPFPADTMAEKLLHHQQLPPPDIDQFRADAPAGLTVMIRRMLAKRPEDRYQTPAEVAAACTSLLESGREATSATLADASHPVSSGPATLSPEDRGPPGPRKRRWLVSALVGCTLLLAALAVFFLSPWSDWRGKPSAASPTAGALSGSAVTATEALDLTRGLIAHWTFDDGAGTRAADASGNGHHAILKGPQWTTGKMGGALEFDGKGAQVVVESASAFNIPGDLTVAGWIAHGGKTRKSIIVCKGTAHKGPCPFSLRLGGNALVYFDQEEGGELQGIPNASPISAGVWHHIACVRDAKTRMRYIYLNGKIDCRPTAYANDPKPNEEPLVIGSWPGPTEPKEGAFAGKIDDLRIYDRVLSAREIEALAAGAR